MSDNFKGIWIPAAVWLEKDLLLVEKVFLCKIYGLDKGEGCTASNKFFADFFGISKSRCTQIIKKLNDNKYISVKLERKGKMVAKRVVNVLNKGGKLFKEGGKHIKEGWLIDSASSNTKEKNKKEEENIDFFDKRINQQLPFDSVTSNKTLNAIFADKNEAIQEVQQIFGQEVTENDVSIAIQSFCTVAITNYDAYRGIRSVEKLKNKFIGWIPKSVKYQATQKPLSQKTENLNLEKYILQYYPKELKHWKKNGEFDRLEKLLATDKFKLTNISKNKKNASYTALFLFECCHMRLGNRLNGSTPQRKLESLDRWEKGLNDYNRNKGDLRQLLKQKV